MGLLRERSKQKAFVYHHFASDGGNMQSKMALAYTYTRQDMFDKSVKLYAELAEVAVNGFLISKDSPVIEPIRLHNGAEENKEALRKSKGEEDEDFQILEYQAQKGNAAAMYKVGLFYYFGLRGLRRDHSKALSWFLKAVEKGEPRSMELLGEIYARGAGVERNYTKAFEWLTLASKHHLYSAYNGIGYLYVKGYGVDSKNYTKAKEYFEKAAENDEVGGHYNLGVMFLKGIGVKRDVRLACANEKLLINLGEGIGASKLVTMSDIELEQGQLDNKEKPKRIPLTRLAKLNKPEVPVILLGSIAAIIHGVVFPIFGLLFSSVISMFFKPPDQQRKESRLWSLLYVGLGFVTLVVLPLQNYFFGIAGEKLIERVRSLTFEKIVHQEIRWFDNPANSSGAVGARLSTDASTVKSLVGFSFLALYCTNAFTFYIGSILVQHGKATFQEVFRVFFCLTMTAISVSQSSALAPDANKAKDSTASIFEILDSKLDIDSSSKEGVMQETVVGKPKLSKAVQYSSEIRKLKLELKQERDQLADIQLNFREEQESNNSFREELKMLKLEREKVSSYFCRYVNLYVIAATLHDSKRKRANWDKAIGAHMK
ncbi:unnamed protein product [Vicia faba]|uniref:ABC transmembrane type-1 domain-containing protein n=1 Tax=Vicia faba TaxID=3906 RepID=A0AAV0ZDS6_VICFA|nr:unnamed protein product [Vicia faba]